LRESKIKTTTAKINERNELVKQAEQGQITPGQLWTGLKCTWADMTSWDKFAEYAILQSKQHDV
jgi:hypothetical protein